MADHAQLKPPRPGGRRRSTLGRLGRPGRLVGRVSLVGAGPGDPDLLTLRAARRLMEADVVYYDALVSSEILALCAPGARRIPVGKRRGLALLSQEAIQAALIRDARAGLRVVRLKGGDPYVFGRGGEEALALRREQVPFEVVPGLTAGTAVTALAGIPVTHRGLSGSVAFVTAHDLASEGEGEDLRRRLAHLARGAQTLVLYMAGAELAEVRRTLLEAGLPADLAAALIESGSTPDERVFLGTLGSLETIRRNEAPGGGPVLLVLGRTVALATRLRENHDRMSSKHEQRTDSAPAPRPLGPARL